MWGCFHLLTAFMNTDIFPTRLHRSPHLYLIFLRLIYVSPNLEISVLYIGIFACIYGAPFAS